MASPASDIVDNCSCRCLKAAKIGDVQSAAPRLKWLWLKEINICAAEGGHVDVLQW